MKRRLFAALLVGCYGTSPAHAASPTHAVTGTQHDLTTTGTAPVKSTGVDQCSFCHAPHNVNPAILPLWDQKLSTITYTTYSSSTYTSGTQAPAAGSSRLCLSCHDGTVAIGVTTQTPARTLPTTGSMNSADVFGSNLAKSHPVGMTAVDDGQLATSLFSTPPATHDPAVKLDTGKTECVTCHDPHVQNNDPRSPMFLVRSNSGGALCRACHDPSRAQPNVLNGWPTGAHATSTDAVPTTAPAFAAYGTVAADACGSCHGAHNNTAAARSLKAAEEADCWPCHSGANVSPALLNIQSEFSKTYSHPTTKVSGAHDPAESIPVNSTRHAECPDCHNPHAAYAQTGVALAPTIEATLAGASGYDTGGVLRPATKEYQTCFKCHADSTNKPTTSAYGRTAVRYPYPPGTTLAAKLTSLGVTAPPAPGDQYNIRLKLMSPISHNVMGFSVPTTLNTTLRPFMLNVDGTQNSSRPLSPTSQIYCTDCHSNDQARAFKGTGPNGPHGSANIHLLQFSLYQAGVTGTGGSSASTAPGYALCNKCHNVNDATGTAVKRIGPHNNNHNSVACTTCHDPHGVIGGNPVSNFALINFDTYEVKAGSTGYGLWGTRSGATVTGGCYLTCHGQNHSNNSFNGG